MRGLKSAAEFAKLRWHCRRGMRELDALLLGWLDTHYENTDDQTRRLFSELLELQDPEIMALINRSHANIPNDQGNNLGSNQSRKPGHRAGNHSSDNPDSSKDGRFETILNEIRASVSN